MSVHLVENGVHGLFPFGTTGEFYAVNDEEFVQGLKTVKEAVVGYKDCYGTPIQLLAGTSHITTRGIIHLIKLVEEVGGYDAVSVLTPMFVSQTQEELYQYYKTIAASTDMPIIMYNNKPKTNVTIAPATVARLAPCALPPAWATFPEVIKEGLVLQGVPVGKCLDPIAELLPDQKENCARFWSIWI